MKTFGKPIKNNRKKYWTPWKKWWNQREIDEHPEKPNLKKTQMRIFSSKMQQITYVSSKMQQIGRKSAPDWKTKKTHWVSLAFSLWLDSWRWRWRERNKQTNKNMHPNINFSVVSYASVYSLTWEKWFNITTLRATTRLPDISQSAQRTNLATRPFE